MMMMNLVGIVSILLAQIAPVTRIPSLVCELRVEDREAVPWTARPLERATDAEARAAALEAACATATAADRALCLDEHRTRLWDVVRIDGRKGPMVRAQVLVVRPHARFRAKAVRPSGPAACAAAEEIACQVLHQQAGCLATGESVSHGRRWRVAAGGEPGPALPGERDGVEWE